MDKVESGRFRSAGDLHEGFCLTHIAFLNPAFLGHFQIQVPNTLIVARFTSILTMHRLHNELTHLEETQPDVNDLSRLHSTFAAFRLN